MPPPERPIDRGRHGAWALTWLAYATYYAGRKGFSVAKKPMETDLGIGRTELASIDTGFLAAYAIGQFVNGVLGDRIGARRLIGYGMLLSAAMCAAFGASSSAVAFGFAFLVNGFAQSTGWPGTTRAMAEWTTLENRRQVMGVWATCYQLGGLAATAGAAWLLSFGWRSAFFVPAVLIAIVGVLVLLLLRPGPGSPERREASSPALSPEERAERRRAVRAALRSPTLWCYGTSYFAIKLIRYSLLFWLPYYLADELGYAPASAGYLSTAFEVGGIVGVIGMGVVTHRLRTFSRPLLSALTLVALAGALLLYDVLAPLGTGANVLGLALIGVCLFGPDSILAGAAAQDAGGPHAAATATGLVNGIGSMGAILQGALNAWVSHEYGWRAVFFVLIGLALLAAVALVPTFRRGGE